MSHYNALLSSAARSSRLTIGQTMQMP